MGRLPFQKPPQQRHGSWGWFYRGAKLPGPISGAPNRNPTKITPLFDEGDILPAGAWFRHSEASRTFSAIR